MNIWQYQRRILALDDQYETLKRHLRRLLKQTRFHRGTLNKLAVRTQLDTIKAQTRVIKEEAAFLVRLGRLYDVAKFNLDLAEILTRRDPDLFREVILEINEKWNLEGPKLKKRNTKFRTIGLDTDG